MLLLALIPCLLCLAFAHEDQGHSSNDNIDQPDIVETDLKPDYFTELGSRRVKVSYGTHIVPARSEDNGMAAYRAGVPPPCHDCLIRTMQAQLEYANGTIADAQTGMWLHHTVFVNVARNDSVCPEGMPGQRFFASGNERTIVDLTSQGGARLGYAFEQGDGIAMTTELMNMLVTPQKVVLSMIWEFIPSLREGFAQAVPYWLDVGGCAASDVPAKADDIYNYTSPTLTSSSSGLVSFIGGHLHDGGSHLDIIRNGMVVCSTKAEYSSINLAMNDTEHISSMNACVNNGIVAPGDQWYIVAHYDTQQHQPMKANDGSLEPVMGIAIAYVAPDALPTSNRYARTMVYVLVAVLVSVSLAAAYLVTQKRDALDRWIDGFRNRGWQRVQMKDTDAQEWDNEAHVPLAGR